MFKLGKYKVKLKLLYFHAYTFYTQRHDFTLNSYLVSYDLRIYIITIDR